MKSSILKFTKVASSNIHSIAWENSVLGIRFSSERVLYLYLGVSEYVWNEFKTVESKGTFFQKAIKPFHTSLRVDCDSLDQEEHKDDNTTDQ
jgi:hypothetical protein